MSNSSRKIYTGIVKNYFPLRNYGFIASSDLGGFSIFFHQADRQFAVTGDRSPRFSHFSQDGSLTKLPPKVGDKVVFMISNLSDRPRADPWTTAIEWEGAYLPAQQAGKDSVSAPITGSIRMFNSERLFGFAETLTQGPLRGLDAFIHYEDWRPPLIEAGSVRFSKSQRELGITNLPGVSEQVILLPSHPPRGFRAQFWCKASEWYSAEEIAGVPEDQRLPRY